VEKTTEDAPANSIRQIPEVWDRLKFKLLGGEKSLNQIENDMLRVWFNEPRIHMALVCAARSCPPLRNEPFEAARLDAQLKDQARRFLSAPSNLRIDRDKGKVHLSRIFNWFGEDFVPTFGTDEQYKGRKAAERAVLNFVAAYLKKGDRVFLREAGIEISYLPYDWSLNEK
jgi:hypothetical protein